ncbi:hypothetical protein [Embleya scabrispora]|uniref:hypothetical protein n=1 Tax=Embleya scabrispora TaxID=159449 RepID=UPI000371AE46|nr:hypothetical protein [Embleya scabrispora]MYS87060.1 hypothetical protein [Streptomyces sp. SID5474]
MRLRRCLASTAFLVLFGSPLAIATPVPDPSVDQAPAEVRQVELTGLPDRIRPATPVEITAKLRNTEPTALSMAPMLSVTGDRRIAPDQVRVEVLDPARGTWTLTPLDSNAGAPLPFPGGRGETSGLLAPGASVEFRVRFSIAANVPAQFVMVGVGPRLQAPATDDEPRFTSGFSVETMLLGPDGGLPTRPPTPGETRPSVPDAAPDRMGGIAKVLPTQRRGAGATFALTGVPGWLRAGGGAAEFRLTLSNDTDRVIPGVRPELIFTTGQSPITPGQLVVEAYDTYQPGWNPVELKVLTDPANGRSAHLSGALAPKPWDEQRPLPPGELATIAIRVSIPAGSPVAGGDLAVLAGGGPPGQVPARLASRSDFQVFHVPNPGAPTGTPRLRPELPPTAPDSAAEQRKEDDDDPLTFATVAVWVVLAGVGGTVVHFARKNRRQSVGTELGPDA